LLEQLQTKFKPKPLRVNEGVEIVSEVHEQNKTAYKLEHEARMHQLATQRKRRWELALQEDTDELLKIVGEGQETKPVVKKIKQEARRVLIIEEEVSEKPKIVVIEEDSSKPSSKTKKLKSSISKA